MEGRKEAENAEKEKNKEAAMVKGITGLFTLNPEATWDGDKSLGKIEKEVTVTLGLETPFGGLPQLSCKP